MTNGKQKGKRQMTKKKKKPKNPVNVKRGKRAKNRGKVGERMAVKELKRLFDCEARRSEQYCGKSGDADILTDIPYLHFEVKNTERLNLHAALEQAEEDKKQDDISVVLHKKNRKQWVAIMYLDDLPEIADILSAFNQSREIPR